MASARMDRFGGSYRGIAGGRGGGDGQHGHHPGLDASAMVMATATSSSTSVLAAVIAELLSEAETKSARDHTDRDSRQTKWRLGTACPSSVCQLGYVQVLVSAIGLGLGLGLGHWSVPVVGAGPSQPVTSVVSQHEGRQPEFVGSP